jgi:hypothetical protein
LELATACPSYPLCTGRVLVSTERGPVQHLQAFLGSPALGQSGEHRLEDAQLTPVDEAAQTVFHLP